jgi:hypothetical protein
MVLRSRQDGPDTLVSVDRELSLRVFVEGVNWMRRERVCVRFQPIAGLK